MNEHTTITSIARNRVNRISILFTVPILIGCASATSTDAQGLADVVGCWNGGEVLEFVRPDSQIIFFTVRPDSTLSLSKE